MKRSSAAIDRIADLSRTRVRESDLYLAARGVFTTYGLRLATVQDGDLVNLVKVPSTYLFAHGSLVFAILFGVIVTVVDDSSDAKGVVGVWASALAAAGFFYGHTRWLNDTSRRENPILSFNRRSKKLAIPSRKVVIDRDDLSVMIALSSIRFRADKPEKSTGELKLLFRTDRDTESVVLATYHSSWLQKFDPEILPFVEACKIPYLHVARELRTGDFTVKRVSPQSDQTS